MKQITLMTLIATAFYFASCNSGGSSYNSERPKTPEELREELKEEELNNPTSYLDDKDVSIKSNQVLVSEETFFKSAKYAEDGKIIEGFIVNKATLGKFKDVVVKVSYYSSTETLIDEKQYVFYEYYEPNSSNYFTLKVYPPSAYDKFGFSVVDAKPVYE